MAYTTLIDLNTLHTHLDDHDWIVIDCRFNLTDTTAGQQAYRESHIPGARYAHLDDDLSDPVTASSGRHPLPDPNRLAYRLGQWGISDTQQVVVYDDMGGMLAAARLWWLLRWLGHHACAVLDGGFPAWQHTGRPLTAELPILHAATFNVRLNDQLWCSTQHVLNKSADECLLDARAAARYRGEVEPIDPVAGHIPDAVNLPTDGNLTADGDFLPIAELQSRFAAVLGNHPPANVIHMCGSGVTACHNLLAMEMAGLSGSRLYPGSWSEWIRDPKRPIAAGLHRCPNILAKA